MQSRIVTMQMTLCFYLLMPYISISLYTADKKFVLADASSRLYRPLAYYLAKVGGGLRGGEGQGGVGCGVERGVGRGE